jgi:hypothetical protein
MCPDRPDCIRKWCRCPSPASEPSSNLVCRADGPSPSYLLACAWSQTFGGSCATAFPHRSAPSACAALRSCACERPFVGSGAHRAFWHLGKIGGDLGVVSNRARTLRSVLRRSRTSKLVSALKRDLIAAAAIGTMFLGVFLLPSTSVGLLLIAVGALIMFAIFLEAIRNKQ